MNFNEYLGHLTFSEKGKALFADIHKAAADHVSDAGAAYRAGDDRFGEYILNLSQETGIPPEQLTLYIYIRLSENTLDGYRRLGISDDVFYATMWDFARNCERTEELYGMYGIQQQVYRKWFRLNLDMRLFRLGRLQFEIKSITDDLAELGLDPASPLLSVHIPKGRDLAESECERAYDLAREFFKKHFGMEHCTFLCDSWLLHPWLRQVLPDSSGIIKFQSKFKLLKEVTSYDTVRNWVFPGCDGLELDALVQKTSLQRAAVEKMKNREDIGYAIGIRK